jgi:hypothetical protein
VSIADVLADAVQLDRARWTQADQNRVAKVLRLHGFERKQARGNGERSWEYRRR